MSASPAIVCSLPSTPNFSFIFAWTTFYPCATTSIITSACILCAACCFFFFSFFFSSLSWYVLCRMKSINRCVYTVSTGRSQKLKTNVWHFYHDLSVHYFCNQPFWNHYFIHPVNVRPNFIDRRSIRTSESRKRNLPVIQIFVTLIAFCKMFLFLLLF